MSVLIEKINREIPVVDFLNQELGYGVGAIPMNVSCPFHKDNKPSMRLYSPKERGAYCFSCGKSYNTFDIAKYTYSLQGIEGVKQTIDRLSRVFNIKLELSEEVEADFEYNNKEVASLISKVFTLARGGGKLRNLYRAIELGMYMSKKTGSMKPLEDLSKKVMGEAQ